MLGETGDNDAAEFGVMESPADGAGGGLGVGREVSPLIGRGVHGGATRNHGACNTEVIVLFMVLCRHTWDGPQEWQGMAKRVILYESRLVWAYSKGSGKHEGCRISDWLRRCSDRAERGCRQETVVADKMSESARETLSRTE